MTFPPDYNVPGAGTLSGITIAPELITLRIEFWMKRLKACVCIEGSERGAPWVELLGSKQRGQRCHD